MISSPISMTDPEDHALQRERLTLAFLVALQHLTPSAAGHSALARGPGVEAVEVAEWLNLSVPAVNSALQRARRALHQFYEGSEAPLAKPRPQVQDLLERYIALWEQVDIPGLVALMREDAWFTMPPSSHLVPGPRGHRHWYSRREYSLPDGKCVCFLRAPMAARLSGFTSGKPGLGVYQFMGLFVLGVVGEQIGSLVAFLNRQPGVLCAPIEPA